METQFKNNGTKFNPFLKLIKGIILFSLFFIIANITGGANGLDKVKEYLKNILNFLPLDLADILASLGIMAICILALYCAISGLYRICTFNIYNSVYEDYTEGGVSVKGCDSYPNINRVLEYRESKLSSMSSDRAAELYIGSFKIESLYTGYSNGAETQRTLSYIESKLCSMSSDRGLNYLANKL